MQSLHYKELFAAPGMDAGAIASAGNLRKPLPPTWERGRTWMEGKTMYRDKDKNNEEITRE
ncbi:MAG: hypothetical protein LBB62_10350 [Proteiniphilum sp.]|jgi:hypothetical protein|nr:hypothetical protein [Proteiniphilum sp.]